VPPRLKDRAILPDRSGGKTKEETNNRSSRVKALSQTAASQERRSGSDLTNGEEREGEERIKNGNRGAWPTSRREENAEPAEQAGLMGRWGGGGGGGELWGGS